MLFSGRHLDENAQGVVLMTELTFRIDERFEEKYTEGLAGEIRSALLYVLGLAQGAERFVYSVKVQVCHGSILCWKMRIALPYMDLLQETCNVLDSRQQRIGAAVMTMAQKLKETLLSKNRIPRRCAGSWDNEH